MPKDGRKVGTARQLERLRRLRRSVRLAGLSGIGPAAFAWRYLGGVSGSRLARWTHERAPIPPWVDVYLDQIE